MNELRRKKRGNFLNNVERGVEKVTEENKEHCQTKG